MADEGKINDSTVLEDREIENKYKDAKLKLVAELRAREDAFSKAVVDFEEAKKELEAMAKLREELGDDRIFPTTMRLLKLHENVKLYGVYKEKTYFDFVKRVTKEKKEKEGDES